MAYLAKIEPQAASPMVLTGVPANDTARPDFSAPEPDQYDLMVRSIRAAVSRPQRIAA